MYPNLKLQLWKTGLRQNRLAQMVGVDEAALSKIVNGFRKPDEEMKIRIAQLLSSDVAWLFATSEDRPDPPVSDAKSAFFRK